MEAAPCPLVARNNPHMQIAAFEVCFIVPDVKQHASIHQFAFMRFGPPSGLQKRQESVPVVISLMGAKMSS